MNLKIRGFNLKAGKPIAFIHETDAKKLALSPGDRVEISFNRKKETAIIDVLGGFLKQGEVALSHEIIVFLNSKTGEIVEVQPSERPKSSKIIQLSSTCREYTKPELKSIMQDIVDGKLSDAEIAYFISGVHHCGMSLKETKFLTESIVETGTRIKWSSKAIADKHSIGGIPNNRTTPIVVSICAAAGVVMPKTSSRAITSAAGTADVVETLARVDLSISELKKIVAKTNACLAWGGSLGLAPADDKLIRVEKMLNLDPEPQLLASILAKKLSAGSKNVLIDIPYGNGAKVSKSKAQSLKKKFILLGKKLGMKIKVVLTDGSRPIGNGIGPVLEMRDILRILRRESPPLDLEKKCIMLAGIILEMTKKTKNGKKMAKEILNSGKAYEKFEEIITAQGGKIVPLKNAKFSHDIKSIKSGKIISIDNKGINYSARLAGCPSDKSSGLYLYRNVGSRVEKGEIILTIYSESQRKLKEAVEFVNEFKPIKIK